MNCNNLFTVGRKDLLISFGTAALEFSYDNEYFVSTLC